MRFQNKLLAALLLLIFLLASSGIVIYYVLTILNDTTPFLPAPQVSIARNWAGYIVASDMQNPQPAFSGINGSWIVPAVTDTGVDAFSAVWIGIGGQFDKTLIQVGTEQDFVNGQAVYSAWYEMLPQDSVTIDSMQINPGDRMTASISIDTSTGEWSVSIHDLTSNQSFHDYFSYESSQLSAEWIIERPLVNNSLSKLANFNRVTFSNCTVIFSNTPGSIADFTNTPVIMDAVLRQDQSAQLTTVSQLDSQGTQFSVDYVG